VNERLKKDKQVAPDILCHFCYVNAVLKVQASCLALPGVVSLKGIEEVCASVGQVFLSVSWRM
jgi:hypothetical protein